MTNNGQEFNTCLHQQFRLKEREINKLRIRERHIDCDGVVEAKPDACSATGGDASEIEIIRTCCVHNGSPRIYRVETRNAEKRGSHARGVANILP